MAASLQLDKLSVLDRILKVVRGVDPEMPAQTLAALVYIGRNPGCSQQDLYRALDLSSSTATRITARLGEWERYNRPGLNFIRAEVNLQDRRFRRLYLTNAGQRFLLSLVNVL